MRHALLLCPMLLVLACASAGATFSCTATQGWEDGRAARHATGDCTGEDYVEAFRLGESLAELRAQRSALETRIAAEPDAATGLRRRQRQIDVDIEAIRGVATLRGWPWDPANGENR